MSEKFAEFVCCSPHPRTDLPQQTFSEDQMVQACSTPAEYTCTWRGGSLRQGWHGTGTETAHGNTTPLGEAHTWHSLPPAMNARYLGFVTDCLPTPLRFQKFPRALSTSQRSFKSLHVPLLTSATVLQAISGPCPDGEPQPPEGCLSSRAAPCT